MLRRDLLLKSELIDDKTLSLYQIGARRFCEWGEDVETRTISLSKRIPALTLYLLLVVSSSVMAAQVACPGSERELLLTNNSSQDLWIGGGGGALRSVCVVNASTSCLAAAATIDGTTGTCMCGITGRNACLSGHCSKYRPGDQRWFELRLYLGCAMRSRRWLQHADQSLLFFAAHQSRGAFGWSESVYLGACEIAESAGAGRMGRVLPGSGIGELERHYDFI